MTTPGRSSLYAKLAHSNWDTIPNSVFSRPVLVFEGDHPTAVVVTDGGIGIASDVPRGAIYTADPAKNGVFNKFLFHYNPSSINLSTSVDFNLPTSFTAATDGGGQGLIDNSLGAPPSNAETLNFDIFLNRIIEVGLNFNGLNALLFATYGTLVDLNVLYRTINGFTDGDVDAILRTGTLSVPPTDVGYLTSTRCVIRFGSGDFMWQGYCNGVSIVHQKFVNTMTPVLTTVSISFQRSLTAGTTAATDANSAGGGSKDTTTGATATGSQSGTAANSFGFDPKNPSAGLNPHPTVVKP